MRWASGAAGASNWTIEAVDLEMSGDQAVPLSLVVTEAVSNAIKYAFPAGRAGHVGVFLTSDGTHARLMIEDDGVGIPAGRVETETGTRDGLGAATDPRVLQAVEGGSGRRAGARDAIYAGRSRWARYRRHNQPVASCLVTSAASRKIVCLSHRWAESRS